MPAQGDPGRENRTVGRVYQNINYAILRYMLPILRDKPTVEAIFDKYDCKSSNGAKINAEVSELFRRYVSRRGARAAGVVGSFEPVTEFAIRYDFSKPADAGDAPGRGRLSQGRIRRHEVLGARVREVPGRARDRQIVPLSGCGRCAASCSATTARSTARQATTRGRTAAPAGVMTWTISFPSGIAAYVTVNSDNNNLSGSLGDILMAASTHRSAERGDDAARFTPVGGAPHLREAGRAQRVTGLVQRPAEVWAERQPTEDGR